MKHLIIIVALVLLFPLLLTACKKDAPTSDDDHISSSTEKKSNDDQQIYKNYDYNKEQERVYGKKAPVNSQTNTDKGSQKTQKNDVDTKNLTEDQVWTWVWKHFKKNVQSNFNQNDFYPEMWLDEHGELYIIVRENHRTENMLAAGVSPEHDPAIAHYRIDSNGYLLSESTGVDFPWNIVATYYDVE